MRKKPLKILSIVVPKSGILPFILNDCHQAMQDLPQTVKVAKFSMRGEAKDIDEHLRKAILTLRPDFLFTLNFAGISAEIINTSDVWCVSWFVDNPLYGNYFKINALSRDRCLIFVVDSIYIKFFHELGFSKVFHLPIATNPRTFRRLRLSSLEKQRFKCDVSFVGTSGYYDIPKTHLTDLDGLKAELVEKMIDIQSQNPRLSIFSILEDIQDVLGFRLRFKNVHHRIQLMQAIEFIAMARLRKRIVEGIAEFYPHIYGDDGWRNLLERDEKVKYRGMIDYRKELPKLYNISKINLNITRAHLKTAVTQRVYDASACGGFILTDYREDLRKFFQIDKEIIVYYDLHDLRDKIKFYLRHEKERKKIAERARQCVLKHHTYQKRMETILSTFINNV